MKEYFEIGGAFELPVTYSHAHNESGTKLKMLLLHGKQAELAAHAINSHDELVAMNQKLLKTLKNALEECEFEIRHGGQVCVDTYAIRKEIEMAEGGAA